MFLNVCKQAFFYISRAHISKSKRCFNVKFSTYYFHMNTKIFSDFQICVSVPFNIGPKCEHKAVNKSFDSDDMCFSSMKFSIFLNWNILFPECSKKDQTYMSDILKLFEYILRIKIKNKCVNEDDLYLFLNGPNFTRNGIIIPMLLIKAIFRQVTHQKAYHLTSEVWT